MKELNNKHKHKQSKKPLQIYLTETQKSKLERLANEEGLTMTGYIVDIIRNK